MVVLVGGRLYALAHGVRQKVAHLGVAAGAAVWGVDVVEGTLLDAGGQWCGKAASVWIMIMKERCLRAAQVASAPASKRSPSSSACLETTPLVRDNVIAEDS